MLVGITRADSVSAATKENFNPGHIIDDAVFYNSSSMDVNQIQAFLDSKVPNCDTYGTGIATEWGSSMTRKDYAASRGWNAPPYTCLRDYKQNTPQMEAASGLCGPLAKRDNNTSAQIINEVAKACGINPQVLIVLLDKEQSLITDIWPLQSQYQHATGFDCPDTAPCDPNYAGFFYQVYYAARQFKIYQARPNDYSYIAGRTNRVYWQTNKGAFVNPTGNANDPSRTNQSACGYNNITITNQATAALYIYTPYQPNQSAMNNLYGTGDGCSAYGNRNFWRTFTDWFGSPLNKSYQWTPFKQMSFTNGSANVTMSTTGRVQGEKVYLIVKVLNTGSATWKKGHVNLGLSNPTGRSSSIYHSEWPSKDRPAYFYEDSVPPGGEATYGFWAQLDKTGTYREYFNLVADGITWLNDMGLYYEFQVSPATYTSQYLEQATYTDQTKTTLAPASSYAVPDRRYYNVLKVKNTGNTTWRKGYINLATSGPNDRSSAAYDPSWLSRNRLATFTESSVPPGSTATFEFWSKTPTTTGENKEYVNLVAENIGWFTDYGVYFSYKVNKPYDWLPVSQSAFTDSTATVKKDLSSLNPGEKVYLEVKIRNTGSTPWKKGSLNLGTSGPNDRLSSFRDTTWLSANRAATIDEPVVDPGQIGTFHFWITVPGGSKNYKEYFTPLVENVSWLTDYGLYFPIQVK
jgi:hypothetical protein